MELVIEKHKVPLKEGGLWRRRYCPRPQYFRQTAGPGIKAIREDLKATFGFFDLTSYSDTRRASWQERSPSNFKVAFSNAKTGKCRSYVPAVLMIVRMKGSMRALRSRP
jgi:hypothetical protein